MKKILLFFWETLQVVLLSLLIVIPIRVFVFQPFIVRGISMEPSFHAGDYLIVDELSFRFREPKRGEVIVFRFPGDPSQRYIKRIIGLPRETVVIEAGRVKIISESSEFWLDESFYLPGNVFSGDNFKKSLGSDEYFVMGDNRAHSSDSRLWGAVKKELIIGRVILRLWPPSAFAKVEAPVY